MHNRERKNHAMEPVYRPVAQSAMPQPRPVKHTSVNTPISPLFAFRGPVKPDAKVETGQKQIESPVARLEKAIEDELQKKSPDMKQLVGDMKKRREERATLLRQRKQQRDLALKKELSSNSTAGKLIEQHMCRQYTRTEEQPRRATTDANGIQGRKANSSINSITNRLV